MSNPRKIAIDDVQINSFVLEVFAPKADLDVKSQGWLLDKKSIFLLKQQGVTAVLVDLDKQLPQAQTASTDAPVSAVAKLSRYQYQKVSQPLEMARAKRIYNDALNLQKKILEQLENGQKINQSDVNLVCDDLLDSIFRNPNALSCLTQIREKDLYLLEHSLNVSILTAVFTRFLNKDESEVERIAQAAFLHDVGKIKIPDEVLHKPSRLTPEEFSVIQKHVEYGVNLLKLHTSLSDDTINIIAQHHEKIGGGGYPLGIKGSAISEASRIVSIADIFDALTAERVYKKGMTAAQAFKIMLKMTEDALDKTLVNQFINCMGIYTVGSLVLLDNKRLALVTEKNPQVPLKPIVKTFYHTQSRHYCEVKELDLSKPGQPQIMQSVHPDEFGIPIKKLFNHLICPD